MSTQENLPTSTKVIFYLLAISCGLLGISMLMMGEHRHISLITGIYGINELASGTFYNIIAAISFLLIAGLAAASTRKAGLSRYLGYLLMVIAVVPLLTLASSKMYIGPLGGFPAIGAGQGVIKYFTLFAIGVLLLRGERLPGITKSWIALFPVMLVLLWIGGMKFTNLEAQGIKDLVETSPFMSWMYIFWDVQETSNIIGVYDLIAVTLLIAAIYWRPAIRPAIVLSGVVFLVTQSFLVTFNGALSTDTLLSTSGHFLIKDLWFLACLVLFWQNRKDGAAFLSRA